MSSRRELKSPHHAQRQNLLERILHVVHRTILSPVDPGIGASEDRGITGEAAKEKANALAKLNKLAQTPDPARQIDLQTQAVEALDALAIWAE